MILKNKSAVFAVVVSIMLLLLNSCGYDDGFVSADFRYNPKSEHTFIIDLNSQEEHYRTTSASEVYPASTTKLLTALCALEILDADALITPGDEVYLPPEGSSSAYIRPNHTLTLEMLIEGMMIPSGNDAAYAVAAACGYSLSENEEIGYEEAVEKFVAYMNDYASQLGCTSSNFTTPDGFADGEHYSSAKDMAIIARAAVENEIIMKYSGLYSDDVTYASGHINTWINTNCFLDESSKYYNKNVIGLKTGSLDGNYSLIVLYDDGEVRLLIGVFGAPSDDARYKDVENIIDSWLSAEEINKING